MYKNDKNRQLPSCLSHKSALLWLPALSLNYLLVHSTPSALLSTSFFFRELLINLPEKMSKLRSLFSFLLLCSAAALIFAQESTRKWQTLSGNCFFLRIYYCSWTKHSYICFLYSIIKYLNLIFFFLPYFNSYSYILVSSSIKKLFYVKSGIGNRIFLF